MKELLQKYDVPVPRYTSYPTVPHWNKTPSTDEWIQAIGQSLAEENTAWSMYLHVPFCETLCTFCGCNNTITKNHEKAWPYVDNILNEWSIYKHTVPQLTKRRLSHLHLGGGSPTFLSANELVKLVSPIIESTNWDSKTSEGSIEVDPRRTNADQLAALRPLGFKRVSLGVQDFDAEVQRLINRHQPFEDTKRITDQARNLGYESVNFDLIYGLPKQNLLSFEKSIHSTLTLRPDRIALYSLAIVPWIKPAQRIFSDDDLPKAEEKRALYELARSMLLANGYVEIGMDHFALPHDALSTSQAAGKLHRNFMGYTEYRTNLLLGLGVSSISETPTIFHQNEKVLPLWESKIHAKEIPTHRGHVLSNEDQEQREKVLTFMTTGEILLQDSEVANAKTYLAEMHKDGLVEFVGQKLVLTVKGKPFLRNATAFFDSYLRSKEFSKPTYSKSI